MAVRAIGRMSFVVLVAFALGTVGPMFAARALIDTETHDCGFYGDDVIGRSITGNHPLAYGAYAGTTTSDQCDSYVLAGSWECDNGTIGSKTESWASGGQVHFSLCGAPHTRISSYLHAGCDYSPPNCSNEFDTYSQEY